MFNFLKKKQKLISIGYIVQYRYTNLRWSKWQIDIAGRVYSNKADAERVVGGWSSNKYVEGRVKEVFVEI